MTRWKSTPHDEEIRVGNGRGARVGIDEEACELGSSNRVELQTALPFRRDPTYPKELTEPEREHRSNLLQSWLVLVLARSRLELGHLTRPGTNSRDHSPGRVQTVYETVTNPRGTPGKAFRGVG